MIKSNSAVIEKLMLKRVDCEITILQHKCLSLNSKKIKSVKIVKTVHTKLKEKVTEKEIIVKKLQMKQRKQKIQNICMSTMIINVTTLHQANILIQEKLLLQKIYHDVKIFHRNC